MPKETQDKIQIEIELDRIVESGYYWLDDIVEHLETDISESLHTFYKYKCNDMEANEKSLFDRYNIHIHIVGDSQ